MFFFPNVSIWANFQNRLQRKTINFFIFLFFILKTYFRPIVHLTGERSELQKLTANSYWLYPYPNAYNCTIICIKGVINMAADMSRLPVNVKRSRPKDLLKALEVTKRKRSGGKIKKTFVKNI